MRVGFDRRYPRYPRRQKSSTLVTNLRRSMIRSIFSGVLSIFADRRVANNLQKDHS
jgi:hypothetical protein